MFAAKSLSRVAKKSGISGFMALTNNYEFLEETVESNIKFIDELVIAHNGADEGIKRTISRYVDKYPDKIRVYEYLPRLYTCSSKTRPYLPGSSPHSLANYYNYTLSKTTYDVAIQIFCGNIAIDSAMSVATDKIRKSGVGADLFYGEIFLYIADGKIRLDGGTPFKIDCVDGPCFFMAKGSNYFVMTRQGMVLKGVNRLLHADLLYYRFVRIGNTAQDAEMKRGLVSWNVFKARYGLSGEISLPNTLSAEPLSYDNDSEANPAIISYHSGKMQIQPCKSIGIVFIGTGKYFDFFPKFYAMSKEQFLPGIKKTYYVFTDILDKEFIRGKDDVLVSIVGHLRWPFAALYRYRLIKRVFEMGELPSHIIYMDADTYVASTISKEDFFSHDKPLFGVQCPWHIKKDGPFESDPRSTAYVDPGEDTSIYWQACVWGGDSAHVYRLVHHLAANTDKDILSGIVPVWQDESHLNRYFISNKGLIHTHHPGYAYPEGWTMPYEAKIIHIEKRSTVKWLRS